MLELTALMDQACIVLELEAKNKRRAIREIVDSLAEAGRIKEPRRIEAGLLEREKAVSTGIGQGVAIPHFLTDGVESTIMAVGRKSGGLNFNSPDSQPVNLIFLILGPAGQEHAHLRLLSRLARFVHDGEFRQSLLNASSEGELIEVFRSREEKEL